MAGFLLLPDNNLKQLACQNSEDRIGFRVLFLKGNDLKSFFRLQASDFHLLNSHPAPGIIFLK